VLDMGLKEESDRVPHRRCTCLTTTRPKTWPNRCVLASRAKQSLHNPRRTHPPTHMHTQPHAHTRAWQVSLHAVWCRLHGQESGARRRMEVARRGEGRVRPPPTDSEDEVCVCVCVRVCVWYGLGLDLLQRSPVCDVGVL
jgi:hypothetical protein